VAGELYIGGTGLARGYHGQPARTAEKFIPDCFSREPGRRLYLTGDKVRRVADGNVEFLGRYDDQIKVRGFRVEPAEIEFWLKQHPAVKDARILQEFLQELSDQPGLPTGTRMGEPQLVGYVVPWAEGVVTAQDLRSFLAESLPRYMIPAAWIFLDTLPLTSRGKVDRQALRTLAERIQMPEPMSAPPQTDVERTIAEIWKEVLDLQAVGRQDNFFDLGGHSLLLGKVLMQVRSLSKRPLGMVDLFQYPTVQTLAAYVTGEEPLIGNRGAVAQAEQTQEVRERRFAGSQRLKQQRERRRTIMRGI
jgi:hypothetical protein